MIIGQSSINGEVVAYETSAILMPRTNGFLAQNIEVHNFDTGTNIIEHSSEND